MPGNAEDTPTRALLLPESKLHTFSVSLRFRQAGNGGNHMDLS